MVEGGVKKKQKKKPTVAPAAAAAPAKPGAAGRQKKAAAADIGDIFKRMKDAPSKKPAAASASAATGASPGQAAAGAGSGRRAYVSGPFKGYIAAGGNLVAGKMTIDEAKKKALQNPACLGFTFEGQPGPSNKPTIWLKNKYPEGKGLEEPDSGWTSYKVENRERLDGFMDLRGDGSGAKARTTADGFRVVAADELNMDDGGFTPECPFDCTCCF
ncbi:hypothetical protein DIPPA_18279 [Diplonema papillatum]|nr:hypothetical protein DIPPA_18279 [Diplonema papillatum]